LQKNFFAMAILLFSGHTRLENAASREKETLFFTAGKVEKVEKRRKTFLFVNFIHGKIL